MSTVQSTAGDPNRYHVVLRSTWAVAAFAATVVLVGVCAIFHGEVEGAVRVWLNSRTYNHCFLIVPIAAFMIYERRERLHVIVPHPDFRALLAIAVLSLIWLPISILGILEVRQFLLITLMQATLVAVLGWPAYRKLLAPFLYLYFLVPTGSVLLGPLQDFTARFAVHGLQFLGIPVFSDGTIIEVPAGRFFVAEACAGLRFLIATVTVGVFFAAGMYQSWFRRIIFVVLCVVVPIVANGFRALGIIWAAQAFGSASAVEADHVIYGWGFFTLVLAGLLYGGHFFSDKSFWHEANAEPSTQPATARDVKLIAIASALVIFLGATGPLVAAILERPTTFELPASAPGAAASWRLSLPLTNWKPRMEGADRIYLTGFSSGNASLDRFVALYKGRGGASNLIRSDNRIADEELWKVTAFKQISVPIRGVPTNVTSQVLTSGFRHLLVWSFYVVDNRTESSAWDAKIAQVRSYLAGARCPTAFMAFATDQNFGAGRAAQVLADFLNTMQAPQTYLCPNAQRPKNIRRLSENFTNHASHSTGRAAAGSPRIQANSPKHQSS